MPRRAVPAQPVSRQLATTNLLRLFVVLLVFLMRSCSASKLSQPNIAHQAQWVDQERSRDLEPNSDTTSTTTTTTYVNAHHQHQHRALNETSGALATRAQQAIAEQPDNSSLPLQTFDDDKLKFPLYLRLIATVVCLIIFTVGVSGNLLVPFVVIKTKYLKNSTNLFLINLSMADLLVLIVCMPTMLIELHSKPETWLLGESMCKLSNFVEMFAANGSIFTILAISFERYYAICKPLKAGYKCTRPRAIIIICFIWLLSVVLTSPILIMAKSSETLYIDGSLVNNCIIDTESHWHKMYVFVSFVAFFCLPLLVLMLVYWLISRRLIRESVATSMLDEHQHQQQDSSPAGAANNSSPMLANTNCPGPTWTSVGLQALVDGNNRLKSFRRSRSLRNQRLVQLISAKQANGSAHQVNGTGPRAPAPAPAQHWSCETTLSSVQSDLGSSPVVTRRTVGGETQRLANGAKSGPRIWAKCDKPPSLDHHRAPLSSLVDTHDTNGGGAHRIAHQPHQMPDATSTTYTYTYTTTTPNELESLDHPARHQDDRPASGQSSSPADSWKSCGYVLAPGDARPDSGWPAEEHNKRWLAKIIIWAQVKLCGQVQLAECLFEATRTGPDGRATGDQSCNANQLGQLMMTTSDPETIGASAVDSSPVPASSGFAAANATTRLGSQQQPQRRRPLESRKRRRPVYRPFGAFGWAKNSSFGSSTGYESSTLTNSSLLSSSLASQPNGALDEQQPRQQSAPRDCAPDSSAPPPLEDKLRVQTRPQSLARAQVQLGSEVNQLEEVEDEDGDDEERLLSGQRRRPPGCLGSGLDELEDETSGFSSSDGQVIRIDDEPDDNASSKTMATAEANKLIAASQTATPRGQRRPLRVAHFEPAPGWRADRTQAPSGRQPPRPIDSTLDTHREPRGAANTGRPSSISGPGASADTSCNLGLGGQPSSGSSSHPTTRTQSACSSTKSTKCSPASSSSAGLSICATTSSSPDIQFNGRPTPSSANISRHPARPDKCPLEDKVQGEPAAELPSGAAPRAPICGPAVGGPRGRPGGAQNDTWPVIESAAGQTLSPSGGKLANPWAPSNQKANQSESATLDLSGRPFGATLSSANQGPHDKPLAGPNQNKQLRRATSLAGEPLAGQAQPAPATRIVDNKAHLEQLGGQARRNLVGLAQMSFCETLRRAKERRSGSQPTVSSGSDTDQQQPVRQHSNAGQMAGELQAVRDLSKKQQMDSRRQVVITLFFVVACFFLLFFPYRVFTIWLILSTQDQVKSLGMETYYNLTYFSRILIYLHSAINPIAYNLISTKFRRAFMSILLCRGPATRRHFTIEPHHYHYTNHQHPPFQHRLINNPKINQQSAHVFVNNAKIRLCSASSFSGRTRGRGLLERQVSHCT